MSLDLSETSAQVEQLAQEMKASTGQRRQHLSQALETFASCDGVGSPAFDHLKSKIGLSQGKVAFLVAGVEESLGRRYPPPSAPPEYLALGTDGSQIDVDPHSPVQCYLTNIGKVRLQYGSNPSASLSSSPFLYASPDDLAMKDPGSAAEVRIEGPLVGVRRTLQELEALLQMAQEAPEDMPTLALVDGSLTLWSLVSRDYPEFLRQAFLVRGFLGLLERARELPRREPLLLASYISRPRSTEVVNALRLTPSLCPYEPVADCDRNCGGLASGKRPCDGVAGVMDRDLFSKVLRTGERSDTFSSRSSIVRTYYGPHQVHFFYLNLGEEIARVEVPGWIATDESRLDMVHALVLDQCRRGGGYPVALAEAHELAVLSPGDHQLFWDLVSNALESQQLEPAVSAKERSKRTRWV